MDNLVINISDIMLTRDQIGILSHSLNFGTTPMEPRSGDLRCDLESLYRRLRLHSYFKDEEASFPQEVENFHSLIEFSHFKFKGSSTFNPPRLPALESMILLN